MQITNIHECHSRLRLRLAEYFNYHIYLFCLFLHTNAQPFAAWIVDQMVSVSRENVDVIQAMLEIYVINCHAIPVALNMVNVKTERAFARKDGMDAIAHCVSISTSTSHPFIPFRFFRFIFPTEEFFGYKGTGTKMPYAQRQTIQMKCHEFGFYCRPMCEAHSIAGDRPLLHCTMYSGRVKNIQAI